MRTLTLIQAAPGPSQILQNWLLQDFALRQDSSRELIVNIAVPEPQGLELYGSREAKSELNIAAVIEATFEDAQGYGKFVDALGLDSPTSVDACHGYAVNVTTVLHNEALSAGRPSPGYKLLRGLYLHDDLPDAAAQRIWAHHSDLATRVHVGLARYARHWVDGRLTAGAPKVRGFSDLHFPDEASLRHRYFDSDRGREEILHDIGHFIAGGLPRIFAKEYVF